VCVFAVAGVLPRPAWGQAPEDTLRLLSPANVRVVAQMNPNRRSFTNYIFWDDLSKEMSTLVHDPDTAGWHPKNSKTPRSSLSAPSSGGVYTGTIDRTLTFLVPRGGRVGVGVPGRPDVKVRYAVDGGRENLTGEIDIGQGYTPGQPIRCRLNPSNLDLGFTLSFAPGIADSNATFRLGLEDFEGFHMFRAVHLSTETYPDPNDSTKTVDSTITDLANIGEVSKEEAFGGVPLDWLYFDEIIPALRSSGVYTGFGITIDLTGVLPPPHRLGPNELFWLDENAFNGFTYYYLVTTYDRGYNVSSASQGLSKFDHCAVKQWAPCPCDTELVSVKTVLKPQADLPQVYVVPNPYRSGTSQYTTENYHNFPDNKLRFINVPAWCILKVYTPAGDLVWEFSQTAGAGNIEWDARNSAGVEVASGVYIYRLQSKSGNWVYGRIIIIR
jgi:hypothetical protein